MTTDAKIDKLCEAIDDLKLDVAIIKSKIPDKPFQCPIHELNINNLNTRANMMEKDISELKKAYYKMTGILIAISIVIQVFGSTIAHAIFPEKKKENLGFVVTGQTTNTVSLLIK